MLPPCLQSKSQADACLAGGAHGGDGVVDRGEDVTHTYDGDITVYFVGPSGTRG